MTDRDECLRPHAASAEPMRESVRPPVEIGEGEPAFPADQCDRLGGAQDLLLEELVDAAVWVVRAGLVPIDQDLPVFLRREHRQCGESALRVLDNAVQERLPMADHAADGRRLKKTDVVEKAPDNAAILLVQLEIEIEFGRADRDVHLRELPPIGEIRHRRFNRERHLKKRVPATVALHRNFADDAVERYITGIECLDHSPLYLAVDIREMSLQRAAGCARRLCSGNTQQPFLAPAGDACR